MGTACRLSVSARRLIGLGYQTVLLAELVGQVWSIEIVEELEESAQLRLSHLGYSNVEIRIGDGSRG